MVFVAGKSVRYRTVNSTDLRITGSALYVVFILVKPVIVGLQIKMITSFSRMSTSLMRFYTYLFSTINDKFTYSTFFPNSFLIKEITDF